MSKEYDTRGMKETCLNCGKKGCTLAGIGNVASINENNGCWEALRIRGKLGKEKFDAKWLGNIPTTRIAIGTLTITRDQKSGKILQMEWRENK